LYRVRSKKHLGFTNQRTHQLLILAPGKPRGRAVKRIRQANAVGPCCDLRGNYIFAPSIFDRFALVQNDRSAVWYPIHKVNHVGVDHPHTSVRNRRADILWTGCTMNTQIGVAAP
jgi:hypothetical protein